MFGRSMSAPGWWFPVKTDNGRVFVCVPPKCGLLSFLASLVPGLAKLAAEIDLDIGDAALAYARSMGLGPFTAIDVLQQFPGEPRCLAVRDPAGRFRSLWRDKCGEGSDPTWMSGMVAGLSPDGLLDIIEAFPFGNTHWMPQQAFLMPDARLIRFDELLVTLGIPAVHLHRSRGPECDMPLERIVRHYRADIDLWERAVG